MWKLVVINTYSSEYYNSLIFMQQCWSLEGEQFNWENGWDTSMVADFNRFSNSHVHC